MAKYDPLTGQLVTDTYDMPNLGYEPPGSTMTSDFGLDGLYEASPYTGANGVDVEYPGGYYGGSTMGNWGRSTADLGRGIAGTLGDGYQKGDLGQIGGAFGQWGNDMKAVWNDSPVGQKVSNIAGDVSNQWGDLSLGEQASTLWGGLESMGKLYSNYKSHQLGKEQMNLQKDMWNKTWDANKKQFNEAVSARADSRYNTVDNRDKRKAHKDKYAIK